MHFCEVGKQSSWSVAFNCTVLLLCVRCHRLPVVSCMFGVDQLATSALVNDLNDFNISFLCMAVRQRLAL